MNKTIKFKFNKDNFSIDITGSIATIFDLKQEIRKQKSIDVQKLMMKGKIYDDSVSVADISDGSLMTLLGKVVDNSEVVIESLDVKMEAKPTVRFLEELSQEELAKIKRDKGEILVFGLQNLGNTCYFNSVYQCLGRIPDLRKALISYANSNFNTNYEENLLRAMGKTYVELEQASDTVVPKMLVQLLRMCNPTFAEQERGNFKQQDAVECLEYLLTVIGNHLKIETKENFSKNFIEELFGVGYQIKMNSIGEEVSDERNKQETQLKLRCYIDNNIAELLEGLKSGIKENVELFSDKIGRNVIFEKTQLINRCPPFLTIQFMRFFYKQANENIFGADGQGGKAKILKSVLFSRVLDIYDLCSDDTKQLLDLGRSIETKMAEKDKNYSMTNPNNPVTENMIPTGRYLLIGVVTHKGRSSDSGHYIGWTNLTDEKWVKYDDDVISFKTNQDIQDLKGGGDHHIAYLCFYKRLEVPFQEL